MPTINQLSAVDQINDGDQFPLYSPNAGDARKASFTTVKESLAGDFASLADLAAQTGAGLVGTSDGTTVQQELDSKPTVTLDTDGTLAANSDGRVASQKATKTYVDAKSSALAASGGSSLVGHIASGTGATARTVQAKLRDTVSVKDFGAVGDGVTDDSAAFTAAIAAHGQIVVPSGTYLIENVPLASNKCITIQRGGILKGVTTGSTLFVSSGFITDVEFIGGKVSDCACFYQHTGNSAVAYSSFRFMRFNDITTVFDLTTSVGNDWIGCLFGVNGTAGNIGRGIYFRATGTGQTNLNNIQWCKFLLFGTRAIDFADTSIVKVKNTITQSWFEDGTAGAIFIGGSSRGMTIRDCYFETNNSADPDILLAQSVGAAIHGVEINNSEFATSGASQTCRIRNTGNTYFRAHSNLVTLASGQVFAEVNGASVFHTELRNNYLNAIGAGTYQSRLFSRSGTQMVSWTTAVGSGFVTDDDQPNEYWAGRRVQNVETFTSGDATPSVRKGNFFQTAGTTAITAFDDGVAGQMVWVKAGDTITVLGVSMVLNDVAAFVCFDGTNWLHVNK